ncbi:hypothetical protein BH18ACT2_BH18ACT2_23860 [soil metagenome]
MTQTVDANRPEQLLRPKPRRCPGQPKWDEPSTAGRPAGVSLSLDLSHRPSCPQARRAMPRYRPGRRLPGSLPSRHLHAAPDESETSSRHREDRDPKSQLGWLPTPRPELHREPGRRTGQPPDAATVAFIPCTDSADDDLARRRGTRPFSALNTTRRQLLQTRTPSRSALRSPVRGETLPQASPQVKQYFRIHTVLPRTFSLPPSGLRSSTVNAQLAHIAHIHTIVRSLDGAASPLVHVGGSLTLRAARRGRGGARSGGRRRRGSG